MTAPEEPDPPRTLNQIVTGKQIDDIDPNPEEVLRLKQFLRDNPTQRLATRIRDVFPVLAAEVAAEADGYDTTNDGRYTVRGEWTGETVQAEGLNRGQSWVARFVGEWIGNALREPDARTLANEHYRIMMQQG